MARTKTATLTQTQTPDTEETAVTQTKPQTQTTLPRRVTQTAAPTPAEIAILAAALASNKWLRRARLALLANEPFCLWGPPGVGKTDMLYLLHRVLFPGKPMYTLILSGRDPAEVQGMAVLDHATGVVRLGSWQWVEEMIEANGGTLFLDELSTAAGATQAVGLRVVQEKTVGERALPKNVRVFAAANPPDCAVDGESFKPPTANRMGHIHVGRYSNDAEVKALSKELAPGWCDWILAAHSTTEAQRDTATLVSNYIGANPEALFSYPHSDETAQGYGWPSPRSWAKYATIYSSALATGDTQAREDALLMADDWLGEGQGKAWRTFARNADLPNSRALLDGRTTFQFDPARADRARLVITGVSNEAVRGNANGPDGKPDPKIRAKLIESAWEIVLAAITAKCGDVVKPATKALQNWRIHESDDPNSRFTSEREAFKLLGITLGKANQMLA